MRKNVKFKSGLLSLLLVIGLVLANFSSLGAWAEDAIIGITEQGNGEGQNTSPAAGSGGFTQEMLNKALNARANKDVEPLIHDSITHTIVQNGNVVGDSTPIDIALPVSVTLSFKIPVLGDFKDVDPSTLDENKYVISGDFAKIQLGSGIKLKSGETYNFVVKDSEGLKIGIATFKEENGKVVVDFKFEGDTIYNGERHAVEAEVAANFALDENAVTQKPNGDRTIAILGKSYDLVKPSSSVKVKKTGVVNVNNPSVTWTVVVTRNGGSLDGYKFSDDLKNVGEYKSGTLKVNGNAVSGDVYNAASKLLSYTFPATGAVTATLTFDTKLTEEEFRKTVKDNKAIVNNEQNVYAGSDTYRLNWDGNWGKKTAKFYNGVQYEKRTDGYHIVWEVEFNHNSYTLNDVRMTDTLKKDKLENYQLKFVSAKLEKKVGNSWEFVKNLPDPSTTQNAYQIGNIDYPVRVSIDTIAEGINGNNDIVGRVDFDNYAVMHWGTDAKLGFYHSLKVGEGALITKVAKRDNGSTDFDQQWDIEVKKSNLFDNRTFAYDAFIFDPDVNIEKIRNGSIGLAIKDDNGTEVNTQSSVEVRKLIPDQSRFNKLLDNGFTSVTPANLSHKTYKIYRKDTNKYIGDLVEVWGFDKTIDNKFSIKSRLITPLLLTKYSEASYNKAYLVHDNKIIDNAPYWVAFRSRMLEKQALTVDTAKKLAANNYDYNIVNENVYDTSAKKALDNKETAYNRADRSIIYRISVNAANIHDISEYIGDTVIKDSLPDGWEFVEIKDSKKYLVYEGESFSGNVYALEGAVKAVKAYAEPADFTAAVSGRDAKFTFEKLNKPYVILLKAKMTNPAKFANLVGTIPNTAYLTIKGNSIGNTQNVIYDEGSLDKILDSTNINKQFLTWTIEYKPYTFESSEDAYLEDKLGNGLEIRRNKDDGSLSFSNDNYKMFVGHVGSDGKFVKDGELSLEDLKRNLSYNKTDRILKIKLPDKEKAYQLIYITDVYKQSVGVRVNNTVTLKQGNKTTHVVKPKEYVIGSGYAGGSSQKFVQFVLHKTNEDGTKNFKDVKFKLTYPEGREDILTTGADGKVKSEKLNYNKVYKLQEIEAPTGYEKDNTVYQIKMNQLTTGFETVILNPSSNVKVENDEIVFKNKKWLSNLKLVKADAADKSATTLAGITKRLNGAEFTLSRTLNNGVNQVLTQTTANDGTLTFSGLEDGTYKLKETAAPDGYMPLIGKEYEITVTRGAIGSEVAIKDADANKIKLLDDNKTVAVFNEKVLDFKLIKASLADKNAASVGAIVNRLPGAKFKLTSKFDNTVSYSAITDARGEWIFKNLKTGVYELKEEAAPNGYNALMGTYEVEVTATAVNILNGNANKIKKLGDTVAVVFNEKQEDSFDLDLVKADFADRNAGDLSHINHPLDDAKFSLVLKANPVVSRSAATVNGKLKFTGVGAGVYILKEVKAPIGYASLMDEYEITVTPRAVLGTKVAIKNAKADEIKTIGDTIVVFNEKTYDLKLLKADLDINKDIVTKGGINLGAVRTLLDGARFRLALASDPTVSYVAVTGANNAPQGSIKFTGLKSGTYVLTEEAAPSGYDSVTNSYTIVVTASAVKSEFEIKNPKAGEIRELDGAVVVFNKKRPGTPVIPGPGPNPNPSPNPNPNPNPNTPTPNTPTPGGELPRYPQNNFPDPNDPESPDELVAVDDDGTPQGKYIKKKKPNGDNEYSKVGDDDTPQGVKPGKNKLPKTGGSDTTVYYISGAVLLLLAAGAVVIRRKKKLGK